MKYILLIALSMMMTSVYATQNVECYMNGKVIKFEAARVYAQRSTEGK